MVLKMLISLRYWNIMPTFAKQLRNNIMSTKQAMALRYKEYLQGWAYIPPQDIAKYEAAYQELYQ